MKRAALAFLGTCVLVACGGGDPGGQASTQPEDGGGGMMGGGPGIGASSSASEDGGSSSSSAPSQIIDSGVKPTPTPAVDAAPPPVNDPVVPGTPVSNPQNAFTGSPKYTSKPPTIRANDQHGGTIVTGKSCLGCHDGTTCVLFDFAGTVWQAPALTQGAADVEVRIIDNNNLAYDVHSDVDGNFWHRADTTLALPAFSGVRTSDWEAVGQLNGTSCNSCHYAGNNGANAPPGPQLFVQP